MNKIAIVCEGKTDKVFLEEIIKHLQKDPAKCNFYICGGKSNVLNSKHAKYEKLEKDLETITDILFVVDADCEKSGAKYNGFDNTQNSLNDVISSLNLQNVETETYIMCDPHTKTGTLESLILSTIEAPRRECIENFLACSNFSSKDNHKAVINEIYRIAYPNAPYDFSHPHFDELKSKLNALFDTF